MEDYIRLLMEQIRCRKAHPYIREEILGHLQDQIEDNMLAGMSKEEAEKAAVEDMGSPVEVGVALDRIHRPKMAWGMVGLMAIISIAAIIFHQIISRQIGEHPLISAQIKELANGSSNFAAHTIIGFILMLLVYRIDYSVIARYSKILAVVFIGICAVLLNNNVADKKTLYESMFSMMTLYIPLYGAIIYKYHGLGYRALFKAVLWMIVPAFIAYNLPCLPLAVILLVSMSCVLTIAIAKNWFKVSRKNVIGALWGCLLGLPVISFIVAWPLGLLKSYQLARIQAFFTNNGEANYITAILRSNFMNSNVIGNNGKEWVGHVPEFNSSYIFSYLLSTYGILLGAIVGCGLFVLTYKIFSISFRQKNQLGMCMGCGCGMVILLNLVLNIGENLGLLPLSQTFLPFFSTGGSSIIVCYVLMGMFLSIYRYKNIYPAHIDARLSVTKLTINL